MHWAVWIFILYTTAMSKATVTQKGMFIISLAFRKCDTTVKPAKVEDHDISILCLTKVYDVIEFLGRYTDYPQFRNGDLLAMKAEIKELGTFVVDITDWDRLENEILCTDYKPHGYEYFLERYPQHMIEVRRVPHGIQKRHLWTEFIE